MERRRRGDDVEGRPDTTVWRAVRDRGPIHRMYGSPMVPVGSLEECFHSISSSGARRLESKIGASPLCVQAVIAPNPRSSLMGHVVELWKVSQIGHNRSDVCSEMLMPHSCLAETPAARPHAFNFDFQPSILFQYRKC